MVRLAFRFGAANVIRRDRPLTHDELFRVVPSVFSEDTRAVKGIDGDIKLNRALWVMAETMLATCQ